MQISEEELRVHLNNITQLIHQILNETEGLGFEDFRKNEQLKERIFTQLQEIGEASREIMDTTNPYSEDREIVEALSAFRNARFNQESEYGGQIVWGIINEDLPVIEDIMTRKIKSENE